MKRNVERMRYKTDRLSAGLCLLAIAFDIAYFVMIYSNGNLTPGVQIGADVIINILFLLMAFWASEMAKVYNRRWSAGMLVMALIQGARVFWIPAHYLAKEQLTGAGFTKVAAMLVLSGLCMLTAAVCCYLNSTALRRHLLAIGQPIQKEGA